MTRRAGLMTTVPFVLATLGGAACTQDPTPPAVVIAREIAKATADGPGPTAAQQLAGFMGAGTTLDIFREQLRTLFRHTDVDGDGVLTDADVSLYRALMTASIATSGAAQIMMADLDGDGFVTESELRQKLKYDLQQSSAFRSPLPPQGPAPTGTDPDERIRQEIARLMAADTDRDGRISWMEAAAFVRKRTDQAGNLAAAVEWQMRLFSALAPGKDRVALADVEAIAEALFREIDADHDGTVSSVELEAWRGRQAAAREEQQRLDAEKQRGR